MEVGFLGLGTMGKAMAINLLRHGYRVTVWNRTIAKAQELVALGATVGDTPASVVAKCNYTIAVLSDPAAALSVILRIKPCICFIFVPFFLSMGNIQLLVNGCVIDFDRSPSIRMARSSRLGTGKAMWTCPLWIPPLLPRSASSSFR